MAGFSRSGDVGFVFDTDRWSLSATAKNLTNERYFRANLGYVWRPPNQQAPFRWHVGIPSLTTYVQEQAAS